MKKTYTRKQITEAIAYWKKQLSEAGDSEITIDNVAEVRSRSIQKVGQAFDTVLRFWSRRGDGQDRATGQAVGTILRYISSQQSRENMEQNLSSAAYPNGREVLDALRTIFDCFQQNLI